MKIVKAFFNSRTWVWVRRIYMSYSVIADIIVILGIIGLSSGIISIHF